MAALCATMRAWTRQHQAPLWGGGGGTVQSTGDPGGGELQWHGKLLMLGMVRAVCDGINSIAEAGASGTYCTAWHLKLTYVDGQAGDRAQKH